MVFRTKSPDEVLVGMPESPCRPHMSKNLGNFLFRVSVVCFKLAI